MINNIIDAISVKLFEVFGAEYTIYTENVEQYLKEPCFYIDVVNSDREKIIGERYYSNNAFDICYFTKDSEPKRELRRIADILFSDMEYITLANGDLLHGTKMKYEIVDDVLHFFVNYNLVLKKQPDTLDDMEILDIRANLNSEV